MEGTPSLYNRIFERNPRTPHTHLPPQLSLLIWCVCKEERNDGKVGQARSGRGREFQMDGVANEKEHRPFADRISGTVRRNLSEHTASITVLIAAVVSSM